MALQINTLAAPINAGGNTYSLQTFVRMSAIEADASGNFQGLAVTALWHNLATFQSYLQGGGNPFDDAQCLQFGARIETVQVPGNYVAAALGTSWTDPGNNPPLTVPTVPSTIGGNGLVLSVMLWGVMSLARYAGTVVQVSV